MDKMRGAYLLPKLVYAPLRQLLSHFDGKLLYGLWCWLGFLEICGLVDFTHVVAGSGMYCSSRPRMLPKIYTVEVRVEAAER